jgi:hypothetical protein
MSLNVTVFYNRVPKTGSTSLITTFQSLGKQNNFHYIHSPLYDNALLEPQAMVGFLYFIETYKVIEIYDMYSCTRGLVYFLLIVLVQLGNYRC